MVKIQLICLKNRGKKLGIIAFSKRQEFFSKLWLQLSDSQPRKFVFNFPYFFQMSISILPRRGLVITSGFRKALLLISLTDETAF